MVRGKAGAWGATLCATFALLLGLAPAAPATEMEVQPDGKILLAGSTPLYSGYVARLLPSGEADPSFGVEGVVVDHWLSEIVDLELQPDGTILALTEGGTIARYRADGELDTSFGTDGYSRLLPLNHARKLLLLADGRIVVGVTGVAKFFSEALVAILSPDGRSREWISGAGTPSSLQGVLRRDDGSLVVALSGHRSAALARFVPGVGDYGDDFSHVVTVPDARPGYDKSYGGGAGLVRVRLPGGSRLRFQIGAVAANGDGVVAVGASEGRLVAVGFNAGGLLDAGFGSGGFAYFGGGTGMAGGVGAAETVDGKILVAGNLGRLQGRKRCQPCGAPLLTRLLPTGRLDPSFGRRGISRLPRFDGQRQNARGDEVAPLPDGKVLLAGGIGEATGESVLGRFSPDGTPDRSFGWGGVVRFRACRGAERRQRRTGCLPSARAELRLRPTPGGAALRFDVSADAWAGIDSLRLRLPRGTKLNEAQSDRAKVAYLHPAKGKRRESATLCDGDLCFAVRGYEGADEAVVDIPSRVLRRVGGAERMRPFRLTVGFVAGGQAAGRQTLTLRSSSGPSSPVS